jgi:hypothetical protein
MTLASHVWVEITHIKDTDLVIGTLIEAKNVIERGWTQNTFASDGYNTTGINDEYATGFCLIGAIRKVSPNIHIAQKAEILLAGAIGIDWHELESWNDKWYRTKSAVIKALEKAISCNISLKLTKEFSRLPSVIAPRVTRDNRYLVRAYVHRQWSQVCRHMVDRPRRCQDRLHHARKPMGERLY